MTRRTRATRARQRADRRFGLEPAPLGLGILTALLLAPVLATFMGESDSVHRPPVAARIAPSLPAAPARSEAAPLAFSVADEPWPVSVLADALAPEDAKPEPTVEPENSTPTAPPAVAVPLAEANAVLKRLRNTSRRAEKLTRRLSRDYAAQREGALARRVLGLEPDDVAATGLEDLLTGDSDMLWLQPTIRTQLSRVSTLREETQ